jgi:RNA polymerase sigma-70 factor (ECF subfamily)
MLGSHGDANDAVQETWLRVSRAGTSGVENLGGWLTTILSRVCLDMLRSQKSRREKPLYAGQPGPAANGENVANPEREIVLADAVGLALHMVLETLSPGERVAFVLDDMFDLSFDEIAPMVGRSPTPARQLASRARRRVQGASGAPADPTRQREIVKAFLAASRGGDFSALLALLDPDVVLRADSVAVQMGASAEIRGAAEVAKILSGRARAAQVALIEGVTGLIWAQRGQPRVAFSFAITNGKIVMIDLTADPERLRQLDWKILKE